MKKTYSLLLVILIFLGLFCLSNNYHASAHAGSYGFAKITAEGDTVYITLLIDSLSISEFPDVDTNHDEIVDQNELKSTYDKVIRSYIEKGLVVKNNGRVLPMSHVGQSVPQQSMIQIDLLFKDVSKIGTVSISYDLFFERSENKHTNVATFETLDGKSFEYIFSNDKKVWTGTFGKAAGFFDTAGQFIQLGLEHILTGYDHMLFLIALLLVKIKFRSMAAVVTSFTLAHSITLILAALDIVSLESRFVEATIALTIVYVALENLWSRAHGHRWALTFAFGLIHGFGFAGVLQEIGLPKNHELTALLSFNLGVELGQLLIVVCIYPLLKKVGNSRWWPRAVQIGSILVGLAGAYWFVTRVFT
ncbi:HupE/UreJ family protein [Neobacillus pocheonensis]|uniref:HupE/UreJ family protein n=1 Tax=Neobacillus pocheonensis TaxID=363869 RepID=UPI003D2CE8A8